MDFGWLSTAGPLLVWTVVLSFVFIECALIIGLFLPGDSLLFGAGIVLAQHGAVGHAWALSVAALITAVLGNQLGYYIGQQTGTKLLARRGGRILNQENLDRAKAFLDRRGFLAIIAARWIPWIRTLAPPIAGAVGMNSRQFLMATATGAGLWVPPLVLVGYYGAGLLEALPWLQTTITWLTITVILLGTLYGIWRYRQEMRRPVDVDPDNARA